MKAGEESCKVSGTVFGSSIVCRGIFGKLAVLDIVRNFAGYNALIQSLRPSLSAEQR